MTQKQLKTAIRESHRRQFAGEDYQAVSWDYWQEFGPLTDDELREIESSPDPGCECGFCATAEWAEQSA